MKSNESQINEVKIKELIKNKHNGKLYTGEELWDIVEGIIIKEAVDKEIIYGLIKQYLCYGEKEEKYYFDFRKRQVIVKSYHNVLFDIFKKEDLKKVDSVFAPSEIKNDKNEPTSDELIALEKEIFNRVENKVIVKPSRKVAKTVKQNSIVPLKKNIMNNYIYPVDLKYNYVKPIGTDYEPYGSQWCHDVQVDDEITEIYRRNKVEFDRVRAIVLPEQRSPEWFAMRNEKITASDLASSIGLNPKEKQFEFILKKTTETPFQSNKFCHHGIKYEDIATMIYEYRMNVMTEEFGLIAHPTIPFLAASPDRIAGNFKLDGKHRSGIIGRMLEIKCPYCREIKTDGPIVDGICIMSYYVQVQSQLECCNLEECDFWQCKIREYGSRYEFIEDTNPDEPFRSKETGFEKGCLLQFLPKNRMSDAMKNEKEYLEVVYAESKFIYPPKIEMSPMDCDIWIADTLANIKYNTSFDDYYFDKVLYWKLIMSKNVLINRDREWFAEYLPAMEKVWNQVVFFREHEKELQLFVDFVNSRSIKKNVEIMAVVEKICDIRNPNYKKNIEEIKKNIIAEKNRKIVETKDYDDDDYAFINPPKKTTGVKSVNNYPTVEKKSTYNNYNNNFNRGNSYGGASKDYNNNKKSVDNDDYMFV